MECAARLRQIDGVGGEHDFDARPQLAALRRDFPEHVLNLGVLLAQFEVARPKFIGGGDGGAEQDAKTDDAP